MMMEDSFKQVPLDNVLHIFSNLSAQDLGRCCQVSRLWHDVASKDMLWMQLLPNVAFPVGESYKQYVDRHAVGSKQQLLAHLKNFFGTMSVNQSASYRCFFPFNTACKVTATIKHVYKHASPKAEIKEVSIFMRRLDCLRKYPDVRDHFSFRCNRPHAIRSIKSKFNSRSILPPDASLSNDMFIVQIQNILWAQVKQLGGQVRMRQWIETLIKIVALGAFLCLAYKLV